MSDFDFDDVDVNIERQILISCIVSDEFIKQVIPIYQPSYITNSAARKIIKWCISYYEKYQKAPGRYIKDIVQQQEKTALNDDEFEYIENVLAIISEEWVHNEDNFNFEFLLDKAEQFFSDNSLLNLAKEIEYQVKNGNRQEAAQAAHEYKPVSRASLLSINPFTDQEAIIKAFEAKALPLFTLPGALGLYMNEQLVRGGFIALQGAEKSGKSFFLQELVMRAIRSRCKVALFELGDMTREDRLCRFHQYLAQKPLVRTRVESGRVKVRIPELKIDNDIPVVSFREEMREVLTAEEALKNGVKWEKRIGKNRVELVTETSDTLSIVDIDNILEHWQKTKGWVPDVIALDYAELCRPIDPKKSERGQINDTWKAMRRLSQKWNVLLLTVTQSDALAYGITSQTRKNFSEDKRKFAHPTAFYSINQTIQEKAKNMIRIGTLLVREGEDRSHKEVAVLQCLGLGRPYIDSYEVDVDFEKIKQESQ